MSIKKAKANYHNGTGYDTFHYETQLKQVKVVNASGVVTGDLEAELAKVNTDIDAVDAKVINADLDITNLETKVGNTASLTTTAKTVVPAINELKSKADNNTSSINSLDGRVDILEIDMDNHNHDGVYLKTGGGNLTGSVSVDNSKAFKGKNTSGTDLNLVYIDGSNQSRFGDITAKAIINALNGDLKVYNGTTSYEVFHAGNMGAGSGLDADTLDGVQGATYARKDQSNYFTASQVIDEGKHFYLESADGSEQAGFIMWRNGTGVQKAKISVATDGDLSVFAGSVNGHTFRSTGELFSTYSHVMDVATRETRVQWKNGSADAGVGFYMNNNSNQVGLWDWDKGSAIWTTERSTGTLKVANAIEIQGRKVSIQTTVPVNPSAGDIWFDI